MNSSRALLEPGVHVPIVEVNCSKLLLQHDCFDSNPAFLKIKTEVFKYDNL